jgi:hypothetical protein
MSPAEDLAAAGARRELTDAKRRGRIQAAESRHVGSIGTVTAHSGEKGCPGGSWRERGPEFSQQSHVFDMNFCGEDDPQV